MDLSNAKSGMLCGSSKCDDKKFQYYKNYNLNTSGSWTSWFSEEDTNYRDCGNQFVQRGDCSGHLCDNIRLWCTTPTNFLCWLKYT
eukprot:UN33465